MFDPINSELGKAPRAAGDALRGWLLIFSLGLPVFAADPVETPRPIHWAYAPLARPPIPTVRNVHWPRTAIDYFVLAKLEHENLRPAEPANRESLLRRLSFDLTGLPPKPADIDAFRTGADASTWRNTIDKLLQSRAYGEHWARHWMDLARYADSAGYELDYLLTDSWKYRDWLIHSFETNKRLDRFIQEQLAGDQIWPESGEARDGARFLLIGPRRHEGGIQRSDEREYEWFTDLADTSGSVFLGSTLGCARCHDHKFDPFTQRDYYGLQAIFADTQVIEKHDSLGKKQADPANPATLNLAMRKKPLEWKVLRRGDLASPLDAAVPAFPAILSGGSTIDSNEPQRRARLARWITAADNPIAARVMVNRIWQWHFGTGLVRTPNDFGRQGEAPTHPELLDWLASELISSGWDMNHLHRLILESATYHMSSTASGEAARRDSDGRLLSHFPRRRLQAEELRDAMLAAAGILNPASFGPPVVPPVDHAELAGLRNTHWDVTKEPPEQLRRSVYLIVRRSVKLGFFDAFNAPDTLSSCAGRDCSIVPSQALTLLNSDDSLKIARELAGRLWAGSGGDETRAANLAWMLLFSRPITSAERADAANFLHEREREWAARAPKDGALAPTGNTSPPNAARGAAWVEWCLALFNANEFVYVD